MKSETEIRLERKLKRRKWERDAIKAAILSYIVVLLMLFGLFFLASTAHAAPRTRKVRVHIVVASAMTRKEANSFWVDVRNYYRRNGIPMRRGKLKVVPNYFAHLDRFDTRLQQLHAWGSWLSQNKLLRRRSIAHVMTPLLDGKYFAGYASGGFCKPNAWSVSNVALKRVGGGDGRLFATTVMAHEMAHTLGASHIDVPAYNVMNSDVLPLVTKEIPPMLSHTRVVVSWCGGGEI